MFEYLITDRTNADVVNDTDKGNYNYTDFNRIEQAMTEAKTLLEELGYSVSIQSQTWGILEFPTKERTDTLLKSLNVLKGKLLTQPTLPTSFKKIKYNQANDIEKMLYNIGVSYENIKSGYMYSGEIWGGAYI